VSWIFNLVFPLLFLIILPFFSLSSSHMILYRYDVSIFILFWIKYWYCFAVPIEFLHCIQTITMGHQSRLNRQYHHQQLWSVPSRISIVLDLLAILRHAASIHRPMAKGREVVPMLKWAALLASTTRCRNVDNDQYNLQLVVAVFFDHIFHFLFNNRINSNTENWK